MTRGQHAVAVQQQATATRTNSSISASASSSSSSPSSWAVAAASRARSANASPPSSDSGGFSPAARPKPPRKPRHQSNRAPLRSPSEASASGSSSSKEKPRSSSWPALAPRNASSALPDGFCGSASSAITRASQSGVSSPPPANQPIRDPCSSAGVTPRRWAAMASWTADQLGKATSDTAGLLRAGRQCTAWFAPRRPLATLCGEATGMRSPCACRTFDCPPAQGSASRLPCSPSRLH